MYAGAGRFGCLKFLPKPRMLAPVAVRMLVGTGLGCGLLVCATPKFRLRMELGWGFLMVCIISLLPGLVSLTVLDRCFREWTSDAGVAHCCPCGAYVGLGPRFSKSTLHALFVCGRVLYLCCKFCIITVCKSQLSGGFFEREGLVIICCTFPWVC